MERKEIYKELQMTYDELQLYLLQKYGGAVYDYFATPECKSRNRKVGRTKDGLYCHHMDEDKGGNLGNPAQAKLQPFEWQKKERLVYCNILEHLILHMKIDVLRQKDALKEPYDVHRFFTTGGMLLVCSEINDMFMKNGTSVAWKRRCFEETRENYKDYILLMKSFLLYIDDHYKGKKKEPAFLREGAKVHFYDCDCEILKLNNRRDRFLLRLPTGEEKTFYLSAAIDQLKYVDWIDCKTREMACGYDEFYEPIYNDIVKCNNVTEITDYARALKVDYRGYGYTQYADIKLTKEFGSKNADEYISKALPMYCETEIEFSGKIPRFWRGTVIPKEAKDAFYIVRIETMFAVKDGIEPFVRYREIDLLRGSNFSFEMTDNHYFINRGWTVMSTSDIYDKGKVVNAMITLSLGRDDFILFKKCYNIRHLKILDGCYFS